MKINIGCDLVCISRFKKSLESKKFIDRVFHEEEQIYCNSKKDSTPSYAARFAAKEAFAKALNTGLFADGVSPSDIWIQNEKNGKPTIMVSEKLKVRLQSENISGWDVSLSHHIDYAMASVLIYTN